MACVSLNAMVVTKVVATITAKQSLLSSKLAQRSNTSKCMMMCDVHKNRNQRPI